MRRPSRAGSRTAATAARTSTGGPRVAPVQGQAAAVTFLGRVGVPPTPPWVLMEAGFYDRGEGSGEYYFDYGKFLNGIQLPAGLYVTIDAADGEVNNYNLMDDA